LHLSGRNLARLQQYGKWLLDVVEFSSPAGIFFDYFFALLQVGVGNAFRRLAQNVQDYADRRNADT